MNKITASVVRPAGPRVIIGLDYGTYSTKVVWRRHGDRAGQVMRLDDRIDPYPWFVAPSLVRISEGSAFFGAACFKKRSGDLYRSDKVKLLPPHRRGISNGEPPDPDLEVRVATYLAWVLSRVRYVLDREFQNGGYQPYLNVAAPMDHFEDESLKLRYLRLVGAAWGMTFGSDAPRIQSEALFETTRDRLAPWLDPGRPVPPPDERRYEVLPETVAPIISVLEDPAVDDGLYAVLDVGAGTTEVSTSHVVRRRRKVFCYSDESVVLGGDDFELAASTTGGPGVRQTRVRDIANRITRVYHRVWELGRRKDAGSPRAHLKWKSLTTLLTGGAARRRELELAICDLAPQSVPFRKDRDLSYEVRWHAPSPQSLKLVPNSGRSGSREGFHLLAVAHGLSFHRQEWPKWFPPRDISTIPQVPPIELKAPVVYAGK
jgi:hypothetical protein